MIEPKPSCTDIDETGSIRAVEALSRILRAVPVKQGYETVPVENACRRFLVQPAVSPFDIPPHANSAVDGYAVDSRDLPGHGKSARLRIAGRALAGTTRSRKPKKGECIRIMTGAFMPQGLDTVIMQEHVALADGVIEIDDRHRAGQNVRSAGEDIGKGDTALNPGKLLTPPDIGLLASLGIVEIRVAEKLRVAIASTGDEIHAIGSPFEGAGIYDSNRYSLRAALDRPDIEIVDLGIIEDNPASLLRRFAEASAYCDMIISSGGVSVGEADYTREALAKSGRVEFWKVAIKPGRPLAFGNIGDAVFFGLPGNPVAVLVTFYLFVLPAIEKMLGLAAKPPSPAIQAVSQEDIRKKPGRMEIPRGILHQNENGDWLVKTTGKQGSGILSSMSLANAFILLPHESGPVKKGDRVTVQPFSGLF
ncbi:MAG: molybdopterin molybdotransferase MoeA [Gammaproteobacteria bacterium]